MILGGPSIAAVAASTMLRGSELAIDGSSNGLHGAYIGEVARGSGVYAGETAPEFDGVDDLVFVKEIAALRFTNTCTLAAWVYPTNFTPVNGGGAPRIVSKTRYSLFLSSTGGSITFAGTGLTPASVAVVTGGTPLNAWTHYAAVLNGITVQFYKNGQPLGAAQSVSGSLSAGTEGFCAGDFQNSTTERHFAGRIAHVVADDTPFSPQRIEGLAVNPFQAYENLLKYSEDMSNAVWSTPQATVSATSTLSPDLNSQAFKLVGDAVAGSSKYANQNTVDSVDAGTVMVATVYAKAAEYSRFYFYLLGVTDSNYIRIDVNLATGQITSTFLNGTATIQSSAITALANSWYRVTIIGDPDLLTTGIRRVRALMFNASNQTSYTGDGVSGMYFWGYSLSRNAAYVPYLPTTTATAAVNSYAEEVGLSVPVLYWPLTEKAPALDNDVVDIWPTRPLVVEGNSVSWREWSRTDTLTINDTLGQPVSARFTIVNPEIPPVVGDTIRIIWYSRVLFAGTIQRISRKSNLAQTVVTYECECSDYTKLLARRRITRNFTNLGLAGIVDYLLDNELSSEGLTLGILDSGTALPIVSADGASVADLLREAAASIGLAMYVGFDKTLNFVSTSNPSMPIMLELTNVEQAELIQDLEAYRNKHTVIVEGTPASASSQDAIVVREVRTSDTQIAERQAIEGGSGIYEEIEKIKHPTSNVTGDLQLLGQAYGRVRLATNGIPRSTLKSRVREYGFRAGQVGTVNLASLGASGEWLIQRVTITEKVGRQLVHDLELVQSSLQWRAFLSWVNIVKSAKVIVLPPTALTNNLATFDTPGATTWEVPADVTEIEVTCYGGSGGGGGVRWSFSGITGWTADSGGNGGASGKAIAILTVTPGQVFDIIVGAAGAAGVDGTKGNVHGTGGTPGSAGTSGGTTQVLLSGIVKCQGNGGGGGGYAPTNTDGAVGSGIGDAVTAGGGYPGGAGGTATTAVVAGHAGLIEIRW